MVIHLLEFSQASHTGCCLCPIESTDAFGFVIASPAASIQASGFATMVCSRAGARICPRAQTKILHFGDMCPCVCLIEMAKISSNGIFGILQTNN